MWSWMLQLLLSPFHLHFKLILLSTETSHTLSPLTPSGRGHNLAVVWGEITFFRCSYFVIIAHDVRTSFWLATTWNVYRNTIRLGKLHAEGQQTMRDNRRSLENTKHHQHFLLFTLADTTTLILLWNSIIFTIISEFPWQIYNYALAYWFFMMLHHSINVHSF